MKSTIIFLTAVLTFSGCAGVPHKETSSISQSQEEFALARDLIDQVFSGYINYNREEFSNLLSLKFSPGRSEFLNAVEASSYKGDIEEISYFVDQVLIKGGLLSVTFKWEKKAKDYNTAESSNSKGKAEFVFEKEAGSWLLSQVKGDNPF